MKIYSKTIVTLTVLVLFVLLPFPAAGITEPVHDPMGLIKRTVEEARLIFNDIGLSQEQKIDKLRKIAEERFDFGEMSKRVLAGQWRKLSPEQRSEFVPLFSKLIEEVYSNKFRRYEKEIRQQSKDRVFYLGERVDGSYATVRTSVMTTTGAQVSVDYRLIRKEGQWKVYDVIIEGVSLINNYRTQFREIITSGSYGDLLRRLKKKVGE